MTEFKQEAPRPAPSSLSADDRFAAGLRGFGPLGILAILVILLTGNIVLGTMIVLPIGGLLVCLWVRLSHTSWSAIGYVRPGNWIVTLVGGFVFGIAFKLIVKVLMMPLFGADPINQAYHFLAGNRALLPTAIWAMLAAGFGEETVFRGFAFERLGKLFGSGAVAKISIVLFTSIVFALGHYSVQGLTGSEQAMITGLTFGTIYTFTRKIVLVMVAHAAYDLTALAIIYLDIESNVAHWVFQ
jgi:membrane protease YdiL (CAAX protease family)